MVLLREGFLALALCAIAAWRSVGANAVNQEALSYNSGEPTLICGYWAEMV
jgi:hypothetical protein